MIAGLFALTVAAAFAGAAFYVGYSDNEQFSRRFLSAAQKVHGLAS